MINEARDPDAYINSHRGSHMAGLYTHRVCDQVRLQHGNEAVGALYTALGVAFHNQQRRPEINDAPEAFMAEMLASAGLSTDLAAHVFDESHDGYIRDDTEAAFARTGRDVGTPIITFHPGAPTEGSFFGPVISTIPRGAEAVRLWDAIEVIATTTGVAELKRSLRSSPRFD